MARVPLHRRAGAALERRVSPERTRRSTWFERFTVGRLSWERLVRINTTIEIVGKAATFIWCVVIGTAVIGFNWRDAVEETVNSGKPIEAAAALALFVAVVALLLVRSLLGFLRWRVQRELWRRDVERLREGAPEA